MSFKTWFDSLPLWAKIILIIFLLMLWPIGLIFLVVYLISWGMQNKKDNTAAQIKSPKIEKKKIKAQKTMESETDNQTNEIQEASLVENLKKCPFCKTGLLQTKIEPRLYGLLNIKIILCNNCQTKIEPKNNELYKINFKNADESKIPYKKLRFRDNLLLEEDLESILETSRTLRENQFADIEIGNLPVITPNVNLSLKPNEKVHYMETVNFNEPRSIRNYAGGSVRVWKGVRINTGQAESHLEWRVIDSGTLFLTNKRLIYTGNLRTTATDLKKIVAVAAYRNGIQINKENKQKPELYTVKDPEIWKASIDSLLNPYTEQRKQNQLLIDKKATNKYKRLIPIIDNFLKKQELPIKNEEMEKLLQLLLSKEPSLSMTEAEAIITNQAKIIFNE